MMSDEHFHSNAPRFLAALRAAEARTFFNARLIEKDYHCSLVLGALKPAFDLGLVFKGGTSLSKVHADFFRLSEDLDFALSISPSARRSERRATIEPFRARMDELSVSLPWLRVETPLTGHRESQQYNGELSYDSVISGDRDRLKIEISLREEFVHQSEARLARTLLMDPESGVPSIAPVPVRVLSIRETYAEKVRAALTRRDPAIRDFFDIHSAVGSGVLKLQDPELIGLISRKLAVSRSEPVDLSPTKVERLRTQLETQLRPVLRQADYDAFDLDSVVDALLRASASLSLDG